MQGISFARMAAATLLLATGAFAQQRNNSDLRSNSGALLVQASVGDPARGLLFGILYVKE